MTMSVSAASFFGKVFAREAMGMTDRQLADTDRMIGPALDQFPRTDGAKQAAREIRRIVRAEMKRRRALRHRPIITP
jgi:hypothetical protein